MYALLNTSLCAKHTVRPNKQKRKSLEQWKVYHRICKEKEMDCSCSEIPNSWKVFGKVFFWAPECLSTWTFTICEKQVVLVFHDSDLGHSLLPITCPHWCTGIVSWCDCREIVVFNYILSVLFLKWNYEYSFHYFFSIIFGLKHFW